MLERDVILLLLEPDVYERYRISLPNGILLYGPPGFGKTFIARKLATLLGFSFKEIKPNDLASTYVHGTQGRMRKGARPPDTRSRQKAARNLAQHARALAKRGHRANVPVMICTLPVNERDFEPIGSIESTHRARVAHAHAVNAYATGDFHNARKLYQLSIDSDQQPSRATSVQQEAIIWVARESGAWLCDFRALFRSISPGACIGYELMDDHVHPSLRGQFEVARAIAQRLTNTVGNLHIALAGVPSSDEWLNYANDLGENRFEALGASLTVLALLRGPVFKVSNRAALEREERRVRELSSQPSAPIVREFEE